VAVSPKAAVATEMRLTNGGSGKLVAAAIFGKVILFFYVPSLKERTY